MRKMSLCVMELIDSKIFTLLCYIKDLKDTNEFKI
jgi:hypothetical protein